MPAHQEEPLLPGHQRPLTSVEQSPVPAGSQAQLPWWCCSNRSGLDSTVFPLATRSGTTCFPTLFAAAARHGSRSRTSALEPPRSSEHLRPRHHHRQSQQVSLHRSRLARPTRQFLNACKPAARSTAPLSSILAPHVIRRGESSQKVSPALQEPQPWPPPDPHEIQWSASQGRPVTLAGKKSCMPPPAPPPTVSFLATGRAPRDPK